MFLNGARIMFNFFKKKKQSAENAWFILNCSRKYVIIIQ